MPTAYTVDPRRASLRNVIVLAYDILTKSLLDQTLTLLDSQALAEVVKQLKREAAVLRTQHQAAQERDASA